MPLFTQELEFSDDYPTIEPSLKLDFANARALDPRITFTRASTATYVGRDGLIKTAGEDEARFDHDPATGESLGLLIEESRTNLFEYSEDFTNADWAKFDVSISSNSIIAPDGSTNSYTITEGTTNTQHNITDTTTVTGTKTFSVYAKLASGSRLLRIVDYNATDGAVLGRFDLSNGTIHAGSDSSAVIKDCGNGWYRCSITTTTTVESNYYISLSQSDGTYIYTGDGSSSLYIFGAQLEAGSFPTSYIPTSGATATRGQEKALITGETFNNFFNPTEGFVMGTYKLNGVNTGSDWQTLVTIDDKTASNRLWIYARGGGNVTQWIGSSGGSTQFTPALGANATAGVERTVGGAYALNNMVGVYEGTLTATDTNALLPVGVDRMGIGYRDDTSTAFINGTIKKLFYYPKRLTNTQLQTLTQ